MLIGIPPILGPELLSTLRAMGHGDEIALVDGNYPAEEHARRIIRADGIELLPMLDAILRVLPIDDFIEDAIFRSSAKGIPSEVAPVHGDIEHLIRKHAPGRTITPLSGADFYARVAAAHVVIATSEPLLYANVILRKGVIYPEKGANA